MKKVFFIFALDVEKYFFDMNDYSNAEELDAAATQFTNQQCAGASTFIGQYT